MSSWTRPATTIKTSISHRRPTNDSWATRLSKITSSPRPTSASSYSRKGPMEVCTPLRTNTVIKSTSITWIRRQPSSKTQHQINQQRKEQPRKTICSKRSLSRTRLRTWGLVRWERRTQTSTSVRHYSRKFRALLRRKEELSATILTLRHHRETQTRI